MDSAQSSGQSCVKCGAPIKPSQAVIYGVCAPCWNAAVEAVGTEGRRIDG